MTPPVDGGASSGRTAWFQCFAGIAGDMALACLIDAGADLDDVLEIVRRVPITGWRVDRSEVQRGGLACCRLEVKVDDDHATRRHGDLVDAITAASLPDRVARRSLEVFAALARAEGRLHGVAPEQVHFHEVGGHDALIDVVGTVAALELLEVDAVGASPVAVGTGTVRSAHGILPNPAPAVVDLLTEAPVRGVDVPYELTTPTGAALLVGLGASFGPLPAMTVERSGFGAGSREITELPNCTQVVIGQPVDPAGRPQSGQPVVLLETNVDDATGEQLAVAIERLLDVGAHDAWLTPIIMKKGRPAFTVHALSDPATAPAVRQVLRQATGTFGIRAVTLERWPVARSSTTVTVAGQEVRIKVGPDRAKPEPDDVERVARRSGRSLPEVQSEALAAWRAQADPDGTESRQGDAW